jgi:hypothetical protein
VDLSRSGCYIETYAPAAVGAMLRVRLSLEHLDVNAEAVVRTAHSSIGMGLEFTRFVDDRDRQNLHAIILTVARP